jgi:hypothetical protein
LNQIVKKSVQSALKFGVLFGLLLGIALVAGADYGARIYEVFGIAFVVGFIVGFLLYYLYRNMPMILKIDRKVRQIVSWPLLICGCYSILVEVILHRENNPLAMLIFLGILLRTDDINKKLSDEFVAKFKYYMYVYLIMMFLITISLIMFELFNIYQHKTYDYSYYIAILMGSFMAGFFLPYEFWLFKKYWFT